MIIEIEIDDAIITAIVKDETTKAVTETIRGLIAIKTKSWAAESAIRTAVNNAWNDELNRQVVSAVSNIDATRAMVADAMERKIRGQLTRLLSVKAEMPDGN